MWEFLLQAGIGNPFCFVIGREMDSLKNVLENAFSKTGNLWYKARVFELWPKVVEEKVAAVSEPVRISGKTLTVAVKSSVWAHQLSLLKETIIAKLNGSLGRKMVTDLRFKVGEVEKAKGEETGDWVKTEENKMKKYSEDEEEIVGRILEKAREKNRNLKKRGARKCARCDTYFIGVKDDLCPFCSTEKREETEKETYLLLSAQPWLSAEEARRKISGLGKVQFGRARQKLEEFWADQIRLAGFAVADGEKKIRSSMKALALSYTALKTGKKLSEIKEKDIGGVVDPWIYDILLERAAFKGKKFIKGKRSAGGRKNP